MAEEFEIGLYSHNAAAYKNVKEMLKEKDKVCIIHATGTGKSFISLQLIYDTLKNSNKKILFLAPRNGILEQIQEHISNLPLNIDRTIFKKGLVLETYDSLLTKSRSELENLPIDLLICDECHRIGAEEWKARIDILTESHPNMKTFGITATPVRARGTSKEEDVSETFFEGNVASTYSLAEAIAEGVLPKPNYHAAIAVLEGECAELEEKVENCYARKADKIKYQKMLRKIREKIVSGDSATEIMQEHVKKTGKYIYFCPAGADIEKIQQELLNAIYDGDRSEVEFYKVISGKQTEAENRRNRETFKNNKDKNKLRVMFSINMYNEGIHVDDIDGVIMGRATDSEIVFYQQLGRALSVGKENKSPLIVDLMNNFRKILSLQRHVSAIENGINISTLDENYDLEEGETEYSANLDVDFGLDDELIDVLNELNKIKSFVNDANDVLFEQCLKHIIERYPDGNFPNRRSEERFPADLGGSKIGIWFSTNKDKIIEYASNGNEDAMRICQIRQIGQYERTDLFVDQLKHIIERYPDGNFPNQRSEDRFPADLGGSKIGIWISTKKDKIIEYASNGNEDAIRICQIRQIGQYEKMDLFVDQLKHIIERYPDGNFPNRNSEERFPADLGGSKIGIWLKNSEDKIIEYASNGNEDAMRICQIRQIGQYERTDLFVDQLKHIIERYPDGNFPNQRSEDRFPADLGGSKIGIWISTKKDKIIEYASNGNEDAIRICQIRQIGQYEKMDLFVDQLKHIIERYPDGNFPSRRSEERFPADLGGSKIGIWISTNKDKVIEYASNGNEDAIRICQFRHWDVLIAAKEDFEEGSGFKATSGKLLSSNPKNRGGNSNGRKI